MIKWWKLGVSTFILPVFLVIQIIWGYGSLNDYETIIGIKVIPLSTENAYIFWGLAILIFLHLAFNRIIKFTISTDEISYRVGIIPGTLKSGNTRDITNIEIREKKDHISEVPANMDSLSTFQLRVHFKNGRKLKIRRLSFEEAQMIQTEIQTFLK